VQAVALGFDSNHGWKLHPLGHEGKDGDGTLLKISRQLQHRLPGYRCWSAMEEPNDLIRANRSAFRPCDQAAFKAEMQLFQS
jgi:hypothetical protein